jgi:hypothetical protein
MKLSTPFKLLSVALFMGICSISFAQCDNLLVNPNADAGITGWTFSSGTGTTMITQNSTYGPAFVASYNWTTKSQTVDLLAAGYTAAQLDAAPDIYIQEMFKGHASNYSDFYYLKVELRASNNAVISSYTLGSQSSPITTSTAWDTAFHTFSNYGTGARKVYFESGGDDTEFWSGNYGPFMDNAVVSIGNYINVGICAGQTYNFGTQVLSTAGTYTQTFNTGNCDSTVILNLHVGNYNLSDTIDICASDTFFFNGQQLDTTGTYMANFTSVAGCDSMFTLTLNVHPEYDYILDDTACTNTPYMFGSQSLTTPGVYSGSFLTTFGCDSIVELHLAINQAYSMIDTAYLCPGSTFQFGSQSLTAVGNYNETFSSVDGCDSLVLLRLLQGLSFEEDISVTLCPNNTYLFGADTLDEAGSYSNVFTSSQGCDSTVNLTLLEDVLDLTVTVNAQGISAKPGALAYKWLNCNTGNLIDGAFGSVYNPSSGGTYAVIMNSFNCLDTSACVQWSPTGISSVSQAGIEFYPSPTKGILQVFQSGEESIQQVDLLDLSGKVIRTITIQERGSFSADFSGEAAGLYLIKFQTESGTYTDRIILVD